jgi:hypothetical protein
MSVNYWVIASGLADPADLAQGPWERLNGAPRSGKWLPGALRSGGVGSGKGRGRRGSSEGEDGHEHPTSLEPGQAAPVGTGRPTATMKVATPITMPICLAMLITAEPVANRARCNAAAAAENSVGSVRPTRRGAKRVAMSLGRTRAGCHHVLWPWREMPLTSRASGWTPSSGGRSS